jgi:glycosyltransferase involved in cell wall biosynthesis
VRWHFLASTLVRGGAETMAVALARGLRTRGHEVRWTLLREAGDLGEGLEPAFDLVTDLAPERRHLLNPLPLRDRLRGDEALYVLDHENALLLAAAAAPLAGVDRRAVAVHTTGRTGGRPSLGRAARAALAAFPAVLALSDNHAAYLADTEGVPRDKLRVVPNGIDPAPFAGAPSRAEARAALGWNAEDEVVGTVAMLRPEKNHRLLLEAAARLAADRPRLRLALVGEGEERAALETRAAEADLRDRVRFLGRRADVARVLPAFDLFALPSLPMVETQPVSVIEALTVGVPVVATRVGDVAALLADGAAGRLVPSGDVDALADALAGLLDDASAREELARRGRERAADFTLDHALDALESALAREAA